ncbi:MAG: hypothetical protein K2K31_01590 [Clostridia bacterium]|nr:hypothetical protein [Clostridia bacterium]
MKNDFNFWIEHGLVAGFEFLESEIKKTFRTSEDKEGYLPVRFVFLNENPRSTGFNGDSYTMPVLLDEKYTNIPRDQVYANLGYTFYIDNYGVKEIGYSVNDRVNHNVNTGDSIRFTVRREVVRFKDTDKFNLGAINDTLREFLIKAYAYGENYAKVIVPYLAQKSEESQKYCKDREHSATKALVGNLYGKGIGNVLTDVTEDKTKDNK